MPRQRRLRIPFLPNEILDNIVRRLDNRALYLCLFVSKAVHSMAAPHLFRDIGLIPAGFKIRDKRQRVRKSGQPCLSVEELARLNPMGEAIANCELLHLSRSDFADAKSSVHRADRRSRWTTGVIRTSRPLKLMQSSCDFGLRMVLMSPLVARLSPSKLILPHSNLTCRRGAPYRSLFMNMDDCWAKPRDIRLVVQGPDHDAKPCYEDMLLRLPKHCRRLDIVCLSSLDGSRKGTRDAVPILEMITAVVARSRTAVVRLVNVSVLDGISAHDLPSVGTNIEHPPANFHANLSAFARVLRYAIHTHPHMVRKRDGMTPAALEDDAWTRVKFMTGREYIEEGDWHGVVSEEDAQAWSSEGGKA